MRRIGDYFFVVVVTLAIALIVACGESPAPAPQPQVVKKKIAAQKKTPANNTQKPPMPGADVKATATKDEMGKKKNPAAGDETAQATKETSELVKASLEIASEYDPKGRFDPFEPLFKEEAGIAVVSDKDKRKKRIPQTPLERVAISQLKLSAIMRMSRGNSAMVEDATGKGYVVKKGTYVGLNGGQVIRIDKDRVVVEEEIENVMGELIIQNTELKLQKPAGEL